MKKISIVVISLFSFFFCYNEVFANTINSIDMDIYIDEYGNASVKEVWNTYLDEGTEGYKVFSDLDNASISDFQVYDDTNTYYTFLDDWNTNLSFNDKKYKNGINYTYDGLELCWGISNYGNRIYTLSYKINNFINQYIDNQGIYFKLLSLDQSVNSVNIKISSYVPLNIDNSKIWGFGYDGSIIFENNSIVMNSGYLNSYEYMTLMVMFEKALYNTDNVINKSFDNVYDEAFEVKDNDYSNELKKEIFIKPIIFLIFQLLIIFLPIYLIRRNRGYTYKVKYEGGRNIKIRKCDYYRDIPCNKDIILMYYLLIHYSTMNSEELKKRLISSFILKWILEDRIEFINDKLQVNFDYKERLLDKNLRYNMTLEEDLFTMICNATGGNKILEKNEFKMWCKHNYRRLTYWFDQVKDKGKSYYYNNKYIVTDQKIINNIFKKENRWTSVYKTILRDEALKVLGLKKFLMDFGRMYEKSSLEVELWNYYLICAELFGISKKVRKEMKNFYPEFEYKGYDVDIDYLDDLIDKGYKSMVSAEKAYYRSIARATSSSSSYDYSGSDSFSGGGGSSFESGGSSSGGSSGGGFR